MGRQAVQQVLAARRPPLAGGRAGPTASRAVGQPQARHRLPGRVDVGRFDAVSLVRGDPLVEERPGLSLVDLPLVLASSTIPWLSLTSTVFVPLNLDGPTVVGRSTPSRIGRCATLDLIAGERLDAKLTVLVRNWPMLNEFRNRSVSRLGREPTRDPTGSRRTDRTMLSPRNRDDGLRKPRQVPVREWSGNPLPQPTRPAASRPRRAILPPGNSSRW